MAKIKKAPKKPSSKKAAAKTISFQKVRAKNSPQPINIPQPIFGEPQTTADPTKFRVNHPSDNPLYNLIIKNLLQPIPSPKDPNNLVLSLEKVLGPGGAAKINAIHGAGKIVFHSGGDTGSVRGPGTQSQVADKMVNDFNNEPPTDQPSFFFHLGDVVYSFGEGKYYYDQFYEPYRDYQAPILAIPGNHDGIVYKGDNAKSLEAFIRNFVSDSPVHTNEAAGLMRTSMIQPGVYFAFDAPFVTIIGLYSNVLEDPGVISSQGNKTSILDDQQLIFLVTQLQRVKNSKNAILVAVHHPPFTVGKAHGASPYMLKDLDNACLKAGVWPHAFISGHAHNYQRFTRTVNKQDIPYIVCGNSGHNIASLNNKNNSPLRTPNKLSNDLLFENYDDKNYGYLRIICDAKTLRIEYHDCTMSQKSESDAVTVDLQTHTMISN
ncbi:MAG: hypothetical protein NVS9B7_09800 [Flavisolibacter sp.]